MRLSVTEAASLYRISRTTIYRNINNGKLSTGSDNKIDLSEMIRVFGEAKTPSTNSVLQGSAPPVTPLQSESELMLHEKIRGLELQVKTLQSQLENAQSLIEWFKNQVERPQKLIEHKAKKSLFNRVLSALNNE
jgi:molecular chaperone GrpE (heat shock protein)